MSLTICTHTNHELELICSRALRWMELLFCRYEICFLVARRQLKGSFVLRTWTIPRPGAKPNHKRKNKVKNQNHTQPWRLEWYTTKPWASLPSSTSRFLVISLPNMVSIFYISTIILCWGIIMLGEWGVFTDVDVPLLCNKIIR